jgi:parallel beta-helix repeat protein
MTGRDQFGGSIAPNAIVERNTITGTTHGIHIEIYPAMVYGRIQPSISNNTVSENTVGVYLDGDAHYLTLKNNNLEENYDYNIYLSSPQNLDATYNWWGTTDTQSIKQKIFDFDRDFTLGNVTFVPHLNAPNSEAMPTPTPEQTSAPEQTPTPTPEQTPATSPTSTPTQKPAQEIPFEAIIGAAIVVAVIGVGLGLLIFLIKRK